MYKELLQQKTFFFFFYIKKSQTPVPNGTSVAPTSEKNMAMLVLVVVEN
jgi:hypothetical protein